MLCSRHLFLRTFFLGSVIYIYLIRAQTIVRNSSPFSSEIPTLQLNSLHLTLSSKLLLDLYSPRGSALKGYLGWLPRRKNISYQNCEENNPLNPSICLKYENGMKVTITQDSSDLCEEETQTCHSVSCYKVHWINHLAGVMDCFVIGEGQWYGGGIELFQRWPMQTISKAWYPTVTGDPAHHPSGSVIEQLWLSSDGFVIHVDHQVPLFANFNESGSGKICFTTSSNKHPYKNHPKSVDLSYSVCGAVNIKDAYSYSIHRWFKKPKSIPDASLFRYPIWSTWARYKKAINQSTVLNYAREIKEAEFPFSQLEIDDKWETCYGDLDFDSSKFPEPKVLVQELNKLQIPATLWMHPFCNRECRTFKIGDEKGYWVKDKNGTSLEVKWWNGMGAVLDVTNPDALDWFVGRLEHIKRIYGIESFKFDAGEILWLNKNYNFSNEVANREPNIFSKLYANTASKFGGRVEVRVGYDSQELPVFIRMYDKYSRWDYENGLQTLIPSALQLSLLGYYFILPDMVGGNNYETEGSLPDREFFIRWLEANVFFPAIQFSIPPWDYDAEVIAIAKKMMDLREKYSDYMLNVASQTTITGEPIIRPLWWLAPVDSEALNIDSQFLVGDGIMVAPVLEKGARSRNIYLPDGRWTDVQRNKMYEGSIWLYDYEAPLNFLPFFIRQL